MAYLVDPSPGPGSLKPTPGAAWSLKTAKKHAQAFTLAEPIPGGGAKQSINDHHQEERIMNELTDSTQLAALIREKHQAAQATAAQAVELARQAGELLLQAKAQLPHGAWAAWLAEHCQIADRTARDYMRLARELPRLDAAKRRRVADLPVRQALKALATPRATTPEPPLSELPKEELQRRAPWYDQVTNIALVFFADGLEPDAIAERTGFDLYEVERILNPDKPIRFNCPAERGLLSHEEQTLYAACVDWRIATNMAFSYSQAQCMAKRIGMDHTLPTLNALERQWRARQAHSRVIIDSISGKLPNPVWYICAVYDSRIACGLDREWAGHDLPALLAGIRGMVEADLIGWAEAWLRFAA
jgi:hypothetical protein